MMVDDRISSHFRP